MVLEWARGVRVWAAQWKAFVSKKWESGWKNGLPVLYDWKMAITELEQQIDIFRGSINKILPMNSKWDMFVQTLFQSCSTAYQKEFHMFITGEFMKRFLQDPTFMKKFITMDKS